MFCEDTVWCVINASLSNFSDLGDNSEVECWPIYHGELRVQSPTPIMVTIAYKAALFCWNIELKCTGETKKGKVLHELPSAVSLGLCGLS